MSSQNTGRISGPLFGLQQSQARKKATPVPVFSTTIMCRQFHRPLSFAFIDSFTLAFGQVLQSLSSPLWS